MLLGAIPNPVSHHPSELGPTYYNRKANAGGRIERTQVLILEPHTYIAYSGAYLPVSDMSVGVRIVEIWIRKCSLTTDPNSIFAPQGRSNPSRRLLQHGLGSASGKISSISSLPMPTFVPVGQSSRMAIPSVKTSPAL